MQIYLPTQNKRQYTLTCCCYLSSRYLSLESIDYLSYSTCYCRWPIISSVLLLVVWAQSYGTHVAWSECVLLSNREREERPRMPHWPKKDKNSAKKLQRSGILKYSDSRSRKIKKICNFFFKCCRAKTKIFWTKC